MAAIGSVLVLLAILVMLAGAYGLGILTVKLARIMIAMGKARQAPRVMLVYPLGHPHHHVQHHSLSSMDEPMAWHPHDPTTGSW